jgi:signal transduction histidine kinase
MGAVVLAVGCASERERLRAILHGAGYEVHVIEGDQGVAQLVADVRPLAVLLGADLPGGGGIRQTLRGHAGPSALPVLLLTLRDDDPAILADIADGLDDYVHQAAPAELILARVSRLVRSHQLATMARINEQLVQVGRLLAGIIHEIRGPLSVIRGNAEMMRLSLGEQHECHRWVDPILRNAQLLQLRLEHLMAAVRAGPPVLVPIDVPPLVREATELFLKGTDPRHGKLCLKTEFAADLPRARADAGRILQVLLNLLANAHEAAAGEGGVVEIVVRTEVVTEDGRPWVSINVRDNGPGIPEAFLGRIFEPFFTTKTQGTGYGLFLASEILREHGGTLTACNAEGGGACLALRLPVAEVETAEG